LGLALCRRCGRAEPAPPGGCAPDGEGLTGYTPRSPRGGFFGGMRSARPRGTAARMPWPYISNTCVNDGTVAKRAHAPVKRKPSPRACGARPSAKPGPHKENPRLQRRHASVRRDADIAGVRSPPLRGGLAQHGWPSGGRSEMTRRAVFSEGRGLRARVARPYAGQGISFPPEGCR